MPRERVRLAMLEQGEGEGEEKAVRASFSRVRLAQTAMGTRFELVLYGDDPVRLRAIGEEALAEIEGLDRQLSRYRTDSEICGLNAHAAHRPVAVEPRLFHLLQQAARLGGETQGAFDLTLTPLLECWGFPGGNGTYPSPEALAQARKNVGWPLLKLQEADFTVHFLRPGVQLDLGAIGKGYALERAAARLRDNGVGHALLHGGTSTVYGLGPSPAGNGWPVAVDHPLHPDRPLTQVRLWDRALSVSAVTGRSSVFQGQRFGHILDPRHGFPVQGALLAAVVLPSPTVADAWSTALLVLGPNGLAVLQERNPEAMAFLVCQDGPEGELRLERIGGEG